MLKPMKPRIKPFIGLARLKRQRTLLARIRPRRLFRKPAVLPRSRSTPVFNRPMIWRRAHPGMPPARGLRTSRSSALSGSSPGRADPSDLISAHREAEAARDVPARQPERPPEPRPEQESRSESSPTRVDRKKPSSPPEPAQHREAAAGAREETAPIPEIRRATVEEIGLRKADEPAPLQGPGPDSRRRDPADRHTAQEQEQSSGAEEPKKIHRKVEEAEKTTPELSPKSEPREPARKDVQGPTAGEGHPELPLRRQGAPESRSEPSPPGATAPAPAQVPLAPDGPGDKPAEGVDTPAAPKSSLETPAAVLRKPQAMGVPRARPVLRRPVERLSPRLPLAMPRRSHREPIQKAPDLSTSARSVQRRPAAEPPLKALMRQPRGWTSGRPGTRSAGEAGTDRPSLPDPAAVWEELDGLEAPISPPEHDGTGMVLRKPMQAQDAGEREIPAALDVEPRLQGAVRRGVSTRPHMDAFSRGRASSPRPESSQLVQRAPERSTQPEGTATQAGRPSPKTEAEEDAAPEQVDLDQMAREVYAILKRRLRVERERAYGWGGPARRR